MAAASSEDVISIEGGLGRSLDAKPILQTLNPEKLRPEVSKDDVKTMKTTHGLRSSAGCLKSKVHSTIILEPRAEGGSDLMSLAALQPLNPEP